MSDTLVKLTGLWERTRRGNPEHTYLVGRLGAAKILAFRNHRKECDEDLDWTLFLTEPTPRRDAQEGEGRPQAPEGRQASRARPGPHRQVVSGIVNEMLRARERDPGQRDTNDPSRPVR
jgi:hypothetical protein